VGSSRAAKSPVVTTEEMIRALQGWVSAVDRSRVDIRERSGVSGYSCVLSPKNPAAARIQLEVGYGGLVSIVSGRSIQVSDWQTDPSSVLLVLQGIRLGEFVEDVWELWGHVLKAVGTVRLSNGSEFRDRTLGVPVGKRRLIAYEAW
jgi:hypothetical protein